MQCLNNFLKNFYYLYIFIDYGHFHGMFVQAKRSISSGASYGYLQIVRPYLEGGKVRQQVIDSLGRRDKLVAFGELDGFLRTLAKFSDNLRVAEAVR